MAKLTRKQQIFVDVYLECGNATEAGRRAGYPFPSIQAKQALASPAIQEAIRERQGEMSDTMRELFARRESAKASTYGIVYFLRADNGLVKIGWAADFGQRLKLLNRSLPYQLEILFLFETEDARRLERMFHNYFEQRRVRGKSEWFALTAQDLAEAPIAAHHCNAKRNQ